MVDHWLRGIKPVHPSQSLADETVDVPSLSKNEREMASPSALSSPNGTEAHASGVPLHEPDGATAVSSMRVTAAPLVTPFG